jgi:WD40 repeat protein
MTTTLESFQSLFNGNTKNKSYRTDSGKVHTIDWNVDGSRLASGSLDKSVVIFAYDGKGSMVGKGENTFRLIIVTIGLTMLYNESFDFIGKRSNLS